MTDSTLALPTSAAATNTGDGSPSPNGDDGQSTATGSAQERLGRAGSELELGVERAVGQSQEWVESLRCTVRENPLGAIAVALAAGLLLARLSR
jgi:ElaB/YqjD/DUF883 family membrane-anchored ribosome-binding protein